MTVLSGMSLIWEGGGAVCVRQEAAEVALDGGPSPSPRFAFICRPPALHIMYVPKSF